MLRKSSFIRPSDLRRVEAAAAESPSVVRWSVVDGHEDAAGSPFQLPCDDDGSSAMHHAPTEGHEPFDASTPLRTDRALAATPPPPPASSAAEDNAPSSPEAATVVVAHNNNSVIWPLQPTPARGNAAAATSNSGTATTAPKESADGGGMLSPSAASIGHAGCMAYLCVVFVSCFFVPQWPLLGLWMTMLVSPVRLAIVTVTAALVRHATMLAGVALHRHAATDGDHSREDDRVGRPRGLSGADKASVSSWRRLRRRSIVDVASPAAATDSSGVTTAVTVRVWRRPYSCLPAGLMQLTCGFEQDSYFGLSRLLVRLALLWSSVYLVALVAFQISFAVDAAAIERVYGSPPASSPAATAAESSNQSSSAASPTPVLKPSDRGQSRDEQTYFHAAGMFYSRTDPLRFTAAVAFPLLTIIASLVVLNAVPVKLLDRFRTKMTSPPPPSHSATAATDQQRDANDSTMVSTLSDTAPRRTRQTSFRGHLPEAIPLAQTLSGAVGRDENLSLTQRSGLNATSGTMPALSDTAATASVNGGGAGAPSGGPRFSTSSFQLLKDEGPTLGYVECTNDGLVSLALSLPDAMFPPSMLLFAAALLPSLPSAVLAFFACCYLATLFALRLPDPSTATEEVQSLAAFAKASLGMVTTRHSHRADTGTNLRRWILTTTYFAVAIWLAVLMAFQNPMFEAHSVIWGGDSVNATSTTTTTMGAVPSMTTMSPTTTASRTARDDEDVILSTNRATFRLLGFVQTASCLYAAVGSSSANPTSNGGAFEHHPARQHSLLSPCDYEDALLTVGHLVLLVLCYFVLRTAAAGLFVAFQPQLTTETSAASYDPSATPAPVSGNRRGGGGDHHDEGGAGGSGGGRNSANMAVSANATPSVRRRIYVAVVAGMEWCFLRSGILLPLTAMLSACLSSTLLLTPQLIAAGVLLRSILLRESRGFVDTPAARKESVLKRRRKWIPHVCMGLILVNQVAVLLQQHVSYAWLRGFGPVDANAMSSAAGVTPRQMWQVLTFGSRSAVSIDDLYAATAFSTGSGSFPAGSLPRSPWDGLLPTPAFFSLQLVVGSLVIIFATVARLAARCRETLRDQRIAALISQQLVQEEQQEGGTQKSVDPLSASSPGGPDVAKSESFSGLPPVAAVVPTSPNTTMPVASLSTMNRRVFELRHQRRIKFLLHIDDFISPHTTAMLGALFTMHQKTVLLPTWHPRRQGSDGEENGEATPATNTTTPPRRPSITPPRDHEAARSGTDERTPADGPFKAFGGAPSDEWPEHDENAEERAAAGPRRDSSVMAVHVIRTDLFFEAFLTKFIGLVLQATERHLVVYFLRSRFPRVGDWYFLSGGREGAHV